MDTKDTYSTAEKKSIISDGKIPEYLCGHSFYVVMVYLYDVTVNGDFPKIRRHVPGRYQFHFFCNQTPFFLCHIKLDLYSSFSATHALIAPFFEGLGHFPTSNFAGQNTEVGTHFLCLL